MCVYVCVFLLPLTLLTRVLFWPPFVCWWTRLLNKLWVRIVGIAVLWTGKKSVTFWKVVVRDEGDVMDSPVAELFEKWKWNWENQLCFRLCIAWKSRLMHRCLLILTLWHGSGTVCALPSFVITHPFMRTAELSFTDVFFIFPALIFETHLCSQGKLLWIYLKWGLVS